MLLKTPEKSLIIDNFLSIINFFLKNTSVWKLVWKYFLRQSLTLLTYFWVCLFFLIKNQNRGVGTVITWWCQKIVIPAATWSTGTPQMNHNNGQMGFFIYVNLHQTFKINKICKRSSNLHSAKYTGSWQNIGSCENGNFKVYCNVHCFKINIFDQLLF